MKIAAMWIVLFKACVCSAMFPLSKRRLIEANVALLGGLLLASSFARAVTLHEDDIVGLGLFSNKLLRIDGRTGVRSVISDFSNPAEGPVGGGSGVAISRGQIFVTGENGRIFLVDHRTGRRSVVGDLNQGAIQGSVYPGMAVDPFGRIIGSLQTQGFPEYQSFVVRVAPRIDRRRILFESRGIYFTDLIADPFRGDPQHPLGTILIGAQDHPAFYYILRLDPVTADASLVGDFSDPALGVVLGDFVCPGGLAVEHSGTILAVAAVCDDSVNVLLSVDPKTGYHTVLSDFNNPAQGPGGPSFVGAAVAVQSSGRVIVAANGNLYRVNSRTGSRVLFSDTSNPRQGPPIAVGDIIAVVPHNAGFCDSPAVNSFASPFGPEK
jgi:outer membrane protein assembly factor BamB